MPRVTQPPPEDFRRVLREKALSHSLFYLQLTSGERVERPEPRADSVAARALQTARVRRARDPDSSARVSELVRRFDRPMQYLRPPGAASPASPASPASDDTPDICSSDDDDRAAVRRRSRDLSDDSAVELEPRARRVRPALSLDVRRDSSRDLTLVEAHFAELGAARRVRTPSVVVSDYSCGEGDGEGEGAAYVCAGATQEEAAWLRARALSADSACSACSSCSTLSSRDEDDLEEASHAKKIINVE